MKIVIPMAGQGRRFAEAGYDKPKPLIDVLGKPMIDQVLDCLRSPGDDVTLVTRQPILMSGITEVVLRHDTAGAVDTLRRGLNKYRSGPVLVANCDQLVRFPMEKLDGNWDAAILCFHSSNPHHSYVLTDENDFVTEIAEKKVISDRAVLGVYWFRHEDKLHHYCMVDLVHMPCLPGTHEHYLSSVLGLMVDDRLKVKVFDVYGDDKHILGTPEELESFLERVHEGFVTWP